MNADEFDKFSETNDGRIVLVKFHNGVTRLYKIYSTEEPGSAEFYSVDLAPHELPTIDMPCSFDSDYVEDMIPLIDEIDLEPST